MESQGCSMNSTRLSLDIAHLPLTPFGMSRRGCGGSNRKRNPLGSPCGKLSLKNTKSSLKMNVGNEIQSDGTKSEGNPLSVCNRMPERQVSPMTGHRTLSEVNKNHILLPEDNTKSLATVYEMEDARDEDGDDITESLVQGMSQVMVNSQRMDNANNVSNQRQTTTSTSEDFSRKRDSILTDVDEGSFIEFYHGKENNPPVRIVREQGRGMPQLYYTCQSHNDTKFSTSTKTPLAPFGFQKFMEKMRTIKSLQHITELTSSGDSSAVEVNEIFPLDESIITGSADVLKKHRSKIQTGEAVNSTMVRMPYDVQARVPSLPDISTLTVQTCTSSATDSGKSTPNTTPSLSKNGVIQATVVIESSDSENSTDAINFVCRRETGRSGNEETMRTEEESWMNPQSPNQPVIPSAVVYVERDKGKGALVSEGEAFITPNEMNSLISEDVSVIDSDVQGKVCNRTPSSDNNKIESPERFGNQMLSGDNNIVQCNKIESPERFGNQMLSGDNNSVQCPDNTSHINITFRKSRNKSLKKGKHKDDIGYCIDSKEKVLMDSPKRQTAMLTNNAKSPEVARWVLTSPFKEGSFCSSFLQRHDSLDSSETPSQPRFRNFASTDVRSVTLRSPSGDVAPRFLCVKEKSPTQGYIENNMNQNQLMEPERTPTKLVPTSTVEGPSVSKWVMTSPFEEGSYGSSFLLRNDTLQTSPSPNHPKSKVMENSPGCCEKSLYARLAERVTSCQRSLLPNFQNERCEQSGKIYSSGGEDSDVAVRRQNLKYVKNQRIVSESDDSCDSEFSIKSPHKDVNSRRVENRLKSPYKDVSGRRIPDQLDSPHRHMSSRKLDEHLKSPLKDVSSRRVEDHLKSPYKDMSGRRIEDHLESPDKNESKKRQDTFKSPYKKENSRRQDSLRSPYENENSRRQDSIRSPDENENSKRQETLKSPLKNENINRKEEILKHPQKNEKSSILMDPMDETHISETASHVDYTHISETASINSESSESLCLRLSVNTKSQKTSEKSAHTVGRDAASPNQVYESAQSESEDSFRRKMGFPGRLVISESDEEHDLSLPIISKPLKNCSKSRISDSDEVSESDLSLPDISEPLEIRAESRKVPASTGKVKKSQLDCKKIKPEINKKCDSSVKVKVNAVDSRNINRPKRTTRKTIDYYTSDESEIESDSTGSSEKNLNSLLKERKGISSVSNTKEKRKTKDRTYHPSSGSDHESSFENYLEKVKRKIQEDNDKKLRLSHGSDEDENINNFINDEESDEGTSFYLPSLSERLKVNIKQSQNTDWRSCGSVTDDLATRLTKQVELNIPKRKSKEPKFVTTSPITSIKKPPIKKVLTNPNLWRNSIVVDVSSDSDSDVFPEPSKKPSPPLSLVTPKDRVYPKKIKTSKKPVPPLSLVTPKDKGIPKVKAKTEAHQKPFKKFECTASGGATPTLTFLASLSSTIQSMRCHPDALRYVKNFKKWKGELCEKLYSYYNHHIFDDKLPETMNFKWNQRMTKTAGFCYYQIDRSKPNGRGARIELSSKVIDVPERLRDTLIHEVCHAAAWIISGYKDGHGPLWKGWASRARSVFPELPAITTCHSYQINCKYTYKCTGCSYSIGRHSKSLDTERKVCGYCYGKFELILNSRSKSTKSSSNTPSLQIPKTPRTPGAFALFVKENYNSVKKSKENLKHAEVMKLLSADFAKMKTGHI